MIPPVTSHIVNGMKIIFFGSGAFGLPALEALKASRHEILHIVSQPDRPAGRGKGLTPTPVAAWAASHAITTTKPEDVNAPEVLAQLRSFNADAFVVIAFGQKMSDNLLSIPNCKPVINLHSSLLPKYRGAAPINWAVLNNDPIAGACVIEVTSVMDAGAILASASSPIGESETAGELHDRLAELGAPLVPQVLDAIAENKLQRIPQDPALKTRAPKLHREMAWVDFTQPAELVSAKIRGLSPWPGVQVELTDITGKPRTRATILKCRAKPGDTHEKEKCGHILHDHTIACGTGSLEIMTIQPAGKKAMNAIAFANGYGLSQGMMVKSVIEKPQ